MAIGTLAPGVVLGMGDPASHGEPARVVSSPLKDIRADERLGGPARLGVVPGRTAGAPATAAGAGIGPAWRWRQYLAQKPRWSAATCTDQVRATGGEVARSRTECAAIRTPLNWTDLTQGSISLLVTRVRSVTPAPASGGRRLLMVNPGGPGLAADWLAPALARRTPALLRTHDVVAMDPRGTGGSTPIACPVVEDGVADIRDADTAALAAMQDAVRSTVELCAEVSGPLLANLSTPDTAADMDLVRRLLARPTIDFYGVSAGTSLGAEYARRHPGATGRFVLDGSMQFSADWRRGFAWQPAGFQRRLDQQFLPWAARRHREFGLGKTTKAVRATVEHVRGGVGAGRVEGMTPRDFDHMMVGHLYTDDGFLDLAAELRTLRAAVGRAPAGGWRPRPDTAPTGEYEADPSATVFMAVQCNDPGPRASADDYAAEGRELGTRAPVVGYEWLTNACAYWPWPAPVPAAPARSLPPMLMVQAELDPATPWEGALRAHRENPATRLVAVDDQGGHGVYLSDNTCVRAAVDRYLMRGTLPVKDVLCPGDPLPMEGRTYPVGWALASQLN